MRRWMRIGGLAWIAALSAGAGCVLGSPGDPGCTEDAECGEGFSCRAGACFRENDGGAPVPTDGGDGGAEGGDGGAGGGDASDAPSK